MESDNAIPNQKVYLQKQPIKDLIKNLIINPKNRNKRVWINYVEKDLRQLVQWGLGDREIYYTMKMVPLEPEADVEDVPAEGSQVF